MEKEIQLKYTLSLTCDRTFDKFQCVKPKILIMTCGRERIGG